MKYQRQSQTDGVEERFRYSAERPPFRRGRLVRLALAVGLALLHSAASQAHLASFPIAGDSLTIFKSTIDPSLNAFSFTSSGQQVLDLAHDPSTDGFELLVSGPPGSSERSFMLTLDAASWSCTETSGPACIGDWVYSDPTGSVGGITSVTLGGEAISIEASGPNWPWDYTPAQSEIWVQFWIEQELFCSEFSTETGASFDYNVDGLVIASDASAPGACPASFCGNAFVEPGEQCDDGNDNETDGCTSTCQIGVCDAPEYDSTWAAIHDIIIDTQCTVCHGSSPLGNSLDLTFDNALDNMIRVPSGNFYNEDNLIEPGQPSQSFFWKKLAAKTLGTPLDSGEGAGMPVSAGDGLTPELLSAIEEWIYASAPEDGVVQAATEYLQACLPPSTPHKIEPPAPPALGSGVQLLQTEWPLPGVQTNPNGETEICMATYYDFTQGNQVPEAYRTPCPGVFGANNPTDECFMYDDQILYQDPQSHHSLIDIYTGDHPISVPGEPLEFGPFTYKDGPQKGQSCDPTQVNLGVGYTPECSGQVVTSLACLTGFGPEDFSAVTTSRFSGSQESYSERTPAPGVYNILPMQGVVVWNSHAFNPHETDTTMDQYLNLYFAEGRDQLYPARAIFDSDQIFAEYVPPFETQEVCKTYTIPKYSHLYNLGSHTHQYGVRFRTWLPPNQPCSPVPQNNGAATGTGCYPRSDTPTYYSTEYTDPVSLDIEPPLYFDSDNVADRTLLFCSLYDNGSTPDSPPVKLASEAAYPPGYLSSCAFTAIVPDCGPCLDPSNPSASPIACVGGTEQGKLCFGDDSLCGGGGSCNACPVVGGVTTTAEMFILLGSYYRAVPEPGAGSLMMVGVSALVWLARRRQTERKL
ncbi:MAG: hypothetical protein CMN75_15850 [Spirochaeta sp.]|nr:hypothetical protein [Spirochaeta sp.]RPG03224.1 MAG: hypothetical protein CBC32_016370 [Proteobacteria bacterium TMED72]